YWCYDRHRSVRLVVLVGLAIDQIAQSGLSSLSVIYYSAQLFSKEGIFSEETCIGLKISFSNNDHDSFSEPELFFVST
ncbi:hypothetical protein J5E52_28880, partial [Klebsiella pneumoniae]|uniref:hypothetical protein n=1 Tax=Klebsiella pneumoniae TaxID=573 RepID=UPI001AAE6734